MALEAKDVYLQLFLRISDLNKTAFQYRAVYLALLAAYYTSLSFLSSVAGNAQILSADLTYESLLIGLTVAAFVGVVVFYFFDSITQDLVEHCITAIASIETQCIGNERWSIFRNDARKLISLRISIVITLLYAIPALIIFSYLTALSRTILSRLDSTPYPLALNDLCGKSINSLMDSVQIQNWTLKCLDPENLRFFGTEIKDIVLYSYAVALCFISYFVIITLQRLLGRAFIYWGWSDAGRRRMIIFLNRSVLACTVSFSFLVIGIFLESFLSNYVLIGIIFFDFSFESSNFMSLPQFMDFCDSWSWLDSVRFYICDFPEP